MIKVDRMTSIAKVLEMVKEHGKENVDNRGLWYDWFCKDSALQNRGKALLTRLSSVVKANAKNENPKFDPDKCRVVFKNCCPLDGQLYDTMFIIDIDTDETLFDIIPKIGHYSGNFGLSELWAGGTDPHTEIIDEWKKVIDYFKGN